MEKKNSLNDIMEKVSAIWRRFFGKIGEISLDWRMILPYVILQERVMTPHEVKVVFLGKSYLHIASRKKNLKPFKSSHIVNFASKMLKEISMKLPHLICDGLIRVDVFKSNEGHLVVNEFESLEANYESGNPKGDSLVVDYLTKYWECKMLECFSLLAIE